MEIFHIFRTNSKTYESLQLRGNLFPTSDVVNPVHSFDHPLRSLVAAKPSILFTQPLNGTRLQEPEDMTRELGTDPRLSAKAGRANDRPQGAAKIALLLICSREGRQHDSVRLDNERCIRQVSPRTGDKRARGVGAGGRTTRIGAKAREEFVWTPHWDVKGNLDTRQGIGPVNDRRAVSSWAQGSQIQSWPSIIGKEGSEEWIAGYN